MATGTVMVSGRAMKAVAPNSPSETAKAKPAPGGGRSGHQGEVDLSPDPAWGRTEHRGRLPQPGAHRAHHRHHGAHHEGHGDQGVGQGD